MILSRLSWSNKNFLTEYGVIINVCPSDQTKPQRAIPRLASLLQVENWICGFSQHTWWKCKLTWEKLSIRNGGGIVSASVNIIKYVASCRTISTRRKCILPPWSLKWKTHNFNALSSHSAYLLYIRILLEVKVGVIRYDGVLMANERTWFDSLKLRFSKGHNLK